LAGVVGDYAKDTRTIDTFAVIVSDLAGIGAREDARNTVEQLLVFSRKFLDSSKIGNARDSVAPKIAAALAAVGDFEAAFAWSQGVQTEGNVLGEIALSASKSLNAAAARKLVGESARRLAKLKWADQTYFGLSDLAEAQARLGDVDAARRSATAIGVGSSRGGDDMTDGQPYALIRVAQVQRQASDSAGARTTLRDAFRIVKEHPAMRGRDGRYSQIAHAQIASGDIEGALETVAAIKENRSAILSSIARVQAAAGELIAAQATFARALRESGQSVEHPPVPSARLAQLPGVKQNMPASARMNLAEIQAMAGDAPGALNTLRTIDDEVYVRAAWRQIVAARATAGDVAGALALALDEAKKPEERRSALEGLGQGVDSRVLIESRNRAHESSK